MTRATLAIGCGGTIGGAWAVAALHALVEQTGFDPASAAVLQGTSAGAEIVTMLGGGYGVDDLVAMQQNTPRDNVLAAHLADCPNSLPRVPIPAAAAPNTVWTRSGGHEKLTGIAPRGRGDASWLQRLADAATGGADWFARDGIRLVAYRVSDGVRVPFGAPGAPPATAGEALRASWAVPAWMPPVTIGDHTYVDGGAASTVSLDLIGSDEADTVYTIVPMASAAGVRAPGLGGRAEHVALRRPMSKVFWTEVKAVRARGTRVVVIAPGPADMAGLGSHFMNRAHRADAFAASMRTAEATVRRALDEAR